MANTKNKECMAYKNKLAYIKEHNKLLKRFYVSLNPETEAEMCEWMKDKSKATYIKKLIKEDMARSKA